MFVHQVFLQGEPRVPVKVIRMEELPAEGGIQDLEDVIQERIKLLELIEREVAQLFDLVADIDQERLVFPVFPQIDDPVLEILLVGV